MKVQHAVLLAAMAVASVGAHAQTQAPGLWEYAVTMKSGDAKLESAQTEMQKKIDAMPPEQRKQMEAAMASRGIKLSGGTTTSKICFTKEEAADPPAARVRAGNCTKTDVKRSGGTMTFTYTCTEPPSTGQGELTFQSDKAYTMKTVMTSQDPAKPRQLTMETQAKWLAGDCGDVKPRPLPSK